MHETWQKDDYVGSHKTDNWKKIQKKKKNSRTLYGENRCVNKHLEKTESSCWEESEKHLLRHHVPNV